MSSLKVRLIVVAVASLLPALSCGGKAVVDEPAAGGHSASSSSSSSSGSSTSSSSSGSSSSSSTGGPLTVCEQACARFGGCLAVNDCLGACENANPACDESLYGWLECVLASPDPGTCDWPGACAPILDEYIACEGIIDVGMGTGCSVGPGQGCSCFVYTVEMVEVRSDCDESNVCTCFYDDKELGSCIDYGNSVCDPIYGCCATVYFLSGL